MSGFDVARLVRIVVDRPANLADADLEGGIADEHVGPDGIEQLLLGDEPPRVLHEIAQHVERPGCQRNVLAVASQAGVREIERTRSEDEHPVLGGLERLSGTHDATIIAPAGLNGSATPAS